MPLPSLASLLSSLTGRRAAPPPPPTGEPRSARRVLPVGRTATFRYCPSASDRPFSDEFLDAFEASQSLPFTRFAFDTEDLPAWAEAHGYGRSIWRGLANDHTVLFYH